ncbi:MAG TPA: BPTI/Kunitz domain-containing protein, partial [Polyangiaceae bacterium]
TCPAVRGLLLSSLAMRLIRIFSSAFCLLVAATVGCGGSSFNSAEDGGEAGEGGSSSSGNGGTASAGKGSGGKSSAGSSAGGRTGSGGAAAGQGASAGNVAPAGSGGQGTGGNSGETSGGTSGAVGGSAGSSSAGEAGTAGAAGQGPDLCTLPPESGSCSAAFERWYFNPTRGVCETFTYGGCGANENNFETLEACHAACAGHGAVDVTSCTSPTECVVAQARCCGMGAPSTLGEVTAVNANHLTEYTAPCALVDCASAPGPIPAYFGATCDAGHCRAFDLRATDLVTCSAPADCRLRAGLSCCEGCTANPDEFVAIRKDAELSALVCGAILIPCPGCAPVLPEDLAADCLDGRCEVTALGMPLD